MNEPEAVSLASKLFASQGRVASAEIVAEYAEMLVDADCGACARAMINDQRRNVASSRVPTVPQLWAAYRQREGSAEHTQHIGVDDLASKVGETEGFWRGKASYVVADLFPDLAREDAQYVALSVWWAGCEPNPEQLTAFLDGSERWVAGTVEYFNTRPDRTIQANKMAAACRKRETASLDALELAELP